MDEYSVKIKQTFRQICLLAIVGVGGALVFGRSAAVPGLLLGTAGGLTNFFMMAYRVKHCADLPPDKAIGYMRRGWLIRLVFILLVLTLAANVRQINFAATVVGLFSLHIVIAINAFAAVVQAVLKRRPS